ncbi:MAG: hypothetical protein RLZ98_925 [Pseudomonadota bacterium]
MQWRLATGGAAAAAMVLGASAQASAQQGADFYKGKSVTLIVATAAGGGYDFYGRMVGEYMERHLPGSTFVVRNMPGAGHLIGGNYVYASKPDGLTIGTFSLSLIYYQLTELPGVRFDLAKMSWIGKAAADKRVLVVGKPSGLNSFEDVKNSPKTLKMAASGLGSANYTDMAIVAKVAGLNVKIITGYNGNAPELAMRRGEVDGGIASYSSALPFVEQGHGKMVLAVTLKKDSLPRLVDHVKTPLAERASALVGSMNEVFRVFGGPPGIPADRLAALRDAFGKTMKDPEYIGKLAKAQKPHEPAVGEEVVALIQDALKQPPEAIALLKGIVEDAKKVKIPVFAGTIDKLENDARVVVMKLGGGKPFTAKVSGSRTVIKVKGNTAKRSALAAGMTCAITAPADGAEASLIDCK